MRYQHFLCLLLSVGLTISSVTAERSHIVIARSATNSAPKPTSALLLTSTPLPPLDGAKPTPATPKAPANATSMVAKQDMTVEKLPENLAAQTSTTDQPSSTQVESSAKQVAPLQVTGFITRNGNIYEVTDKNGVGMIESRQSTDSENKSTHVCNYGSVVIYSDLPCDQVTNVRIGEPQQSTSAAQQQAVVGNNNASSVTSDKVDDNEFPDFDDGLPQKQKQKRKRVNKKPNKQRRRNGLRNRPNAVRQGVNGKRRHQQAQRLRPQQQQQQQQQQRRRQQINRNKGQQQQQRKRLQLQKQMKRQRQQNGNRNGQRRKLKNGANANRRRFNANAIYDEERRL